MRTMDTEAVGLVVESLRSMRSVGDLCLITGAPGCGKTTALRRAMAELPEVKRVVLTPSPEGASPRAFFRDVAVRIGLQVNPSAGALDLALAVEQEVLSRRWLLVIDQCQRLPRTWLPCYRYLVDQLGGLVLCGTDAFRVRIEGYEDLASPMLPVQMPVPELEEVAEHYREEFIGDWVAEAYTRARGIWKRIETVATATRNVCLHQRRHTTQATADDARRTAELFLLAA